MTIKETQFNNYALYIIDSFELWGYTIIQIEKAPLNLIIYIEKISIRFLRYLIKDTVDNNFYLEITAVNNQVRIRFFEIG